MTDSESLKTFPVLGGIELQYTTPCGATLAAVVFDDGAIDITTGEAFTISLPPGAVSVLRDLILQVIPLPNSQKGPER